MYRHGYNKTNTTQVSSLKRQDPHRCGPNLPGRVSFRAGQLRCQKYFHGERFDFVATQIVEPQICSQKSVEICWEKLSRNIELINVLPQVALDLRANCSKT